MAHKAYAILFRETSDDFGELYFPIKRDDKKYGGMPQFFGGTAMRGEDDWKVIAREINEESDGKITLKQDGLHLMHSTEAEGNTLNFYVAVNFSGTHFLGPLNNEEMQKIAKFPVQFEYRDEDKDTTEDLLNSLNIVPSEEFCLSETYAAFDEAIKWSETSSE